MSRDPKFYGTPTQWVRWEFKDSLKPGPFIFRTHTLLFIRSSLAILFELFFFVFTLTHPHENSFVGPSSSRRLLLRHHYHPLPPLQPGFGTKWIEEEELKDEERKPTPPSTHHPRTLWGATVPFRIIINVHNISMMGADHHHRQRIFGIVSWLPYLL